MLSDTESLPTNSATAERETIALLQEEIARLEDEIRLRDLEAAERAEEFAARGNPAPHDEAAELRIAQLSRDLEIREETIALLLEQVRLADEAEAASRVEWEQLHQWVEEVERRVNAGGDSGTRLQDALQTERRNSEALRQSAEKEQRSWEVQRQALVGEVERLRARFTAVAGESDASVAAVQALEQENRQLRDAYDALAGTTVSGHDYDAAVAELQTVRQQNATLAQELKHRCDELQRAKKEHEAETNSLRSQFARESLRRQEEQVKSSGAAPVTQATLLEADMRIRAFREHLKEIHHDETEQRMRRSLAARLSRLWNHTSARS